MKAGNLRLVSMRAQPKLPGFNLNARERAFFEESKPSASASGIYHPAFDALNLDSRNMLWGQGGSGVRID